MKLRTEVSFPDYPFRIDHRFPSLLMGSCFSDQIGQQMRRSLFPVTLNPFGTLFNPMSVMKALDSLITKERYGEEELEQHEGMWLSFDHSTAFSSSDHTVCLENINRSFIPAREALRNAATLVITWGTSWVYRYKPSGNVVCNCHKIPADRFMRTPLSPDEISGACGEFLPRLFRFNPGVKVLLTVSPVRHWKDGAHGNQLSKASLLLATETLRETFPDRLFYFPSYELVLDELRDYRFYADDMLHMGRQATLFIWEKFLNVLVSDESRQILSELEPLLKLMEHRPKQASGGAAEKTEQRRREILEDLQKKYPFLSWENLTSAD